jgi:mRNA interferase RelE/StbE
MIYRVDLTRKADNQMRNLSRSIRRRIDAKLLKMEDDPYSGAVRLTARPGFRARVGNYRILYEVDDRANVVRVNQIVHRREAYR